MDDLTIPVVTLAAELGVPLDQLVAKLDPDLVLTNSVGFRAVERHVASRLIDEHRARQTRTKQRETARRQRLVDVYERTRATIRGGIVASASGDPLSDLMAADGNPRMEAAEERLTAWLGGRSEGRRISPLTKAT